MAPPLNGFLSTQPSPGAQSVRLRWLYQDTSDLTFIDPSGDTPFTGRLFDPSDVQRSPSNTAVTTAATFTPIQDVDGTWFVDVTFDGAAMLGQWYIRLDYVWENPTPTIMYLGFNVVSAGAQVVVTADLYCTIQQVRRFFLRNTEELADANSLLSKADLEDNIRKKMARIDQVTQRSWRANVVTDELASVTFADKWRWHGDYVASLRTVHSPVRSITALSVYQGGQERAIVPGVAEDREQTWYAHLPTGTIYLVGTEIPNVTRNAAKVSYTWGEVAVPDDIQEACYLLVSAELLESENFAVELPEDSQTAGTIADKATRWRKAAMDILETHKDLLYATGDG